MKISTIATFALASTASARFSGTVVAGLDRNNNCFGVTYNAHDTVLGGLNCPQTAECNSNGNEIVNSHVKCTYNGGQADIFTFPHDTVKFCRAGFCSCMATQYIKSDKKNGDTYVNFNYNDDNAYNC